MLKLYPKTFLGSDFCSWLVSDAAGKFQVKNREEAVTCGLAMFHFKVTPQRTLASLSVHRSPLQVAHHVVNEHGFEDTNKYYYRFYSDEGGHSGNSGSAVADMEASIADLLSSSMSSALFSPTDYTVVVTTSSESSSGTDSSVFLKLVGDGGDSGEFELKQSENFNKFETGQVDTFTFQSNVALGNVLQAHVRLQADGNLIKKSWRLRSIEVSGGDLSAPVKFEHGQVLSPDNPTAVFRTQKAAASQIVQPRPARALSSVSTKVKGAVFSKEVAFGPKMQRLLPSANEAPVCFAVNTRLNTIIIGQFHK